MTEEGQDFPIGRCFKTFDEFEACLKARSQKLGEKWRKASGSLGVERANAKIKNASKHYRTDFKYAWVFYRCIHEGQFVSKGSRREKSSHKIGCPAKLKLVAQRQTDALVVTQSSLQHNHPLLPASAYHYAEDRLLSHKEREEIEKLTGLGVSTGKILSHFTASTGKAFKRNDISNAAFRNKTVSEAFISRETWDVLVKMALENDGTQFSTSLNSSGEVDVIYCQTINMKKFLFNYPDVIFLDGSFCLNSLGYPIFVFLCVDGELKGHTVCYAIVRDEKKVLLRDILVPFMKKNQAAIKTFIVDRDASEIPPVKEALPGINVFLCQFHVASIFKDSVHEFCASAKEKQDAKKWLLSMLYSPDKSDFEKGFLELPEKLKLYIETNWSHVKDSWALHSMQNVTAWGSFTNRSVFTNSFVERHNRRLKTISNVYKNLPNFVTATLQMHRADEKVDMQKIYELKLKSRNLKLNMSVEKDLENLVLSMSQLVTPTACKLVKSQVEEFGDKSELTVIVTPQHLSCEKNGNVQHYNLSAGTCQCLFYSTNELLCWHLILHRSKMNLPLWQEDEIPKRWLLSTLYNCVECEADGGTENMTPSVESDSNGTMVEIQRRNVGMDIWKSLMHVFVSCGQEEFEERCGVLRDLEIIWKTGMKVKEILTNETMDDSWNPDASMASNSNCDIKISYG